jgi:hypothetical protein
MRFIFGCDFIRKTQCVCVCACVRVSRARVADGGDGLQIWGVPAYILNKQSRTADKG